MIEQPSLLEHTTLPASRIVTEDIRSGGIAFLGKTGSGKTVAAKGQVEILLRENRRVCILDPLGVWYGLRSSADGQSPGFPVVVFGGEHADVPIAKTSGAALATLIANERLPAIIDLSGFTNEADIDTFATAFLDSLYIHNRKPLTLVVDEADIFAPQMPESYQTDMLGRMQQIARRGRVRGFRLWQISQRPALLNKSVLGMADTLVAMKMVTPQDRKAMGEWIKGQADIHEGKLLLADLPQLPRGVGWVWSPEQNTLARTAFPMIETFDSSRTPEEGDEVLAAPTRLADVDVSALVASLQAADEQAAENDPQRLRDRIAELEAQIADGNHGATATQRAIDEAYWDGSRAAHQALVQRVKLAGETIAGMFELLSKDLEDETPEVVPAQEAPKPQPRRVPTPVESHVRKGNLKERLLDALAWWQTAKVVTPTREQVGFVAQTKPRGGHFANTLSSMRTEGLIEYPAPNCVALTDAGWAQAGATEGLLTRQVLIERAASVITDSAQLRIFRAVAGKPLHRDDLATAAGLNHGGHFANSISALRTAGLIDYPQKGWVGLSSAFEGLK